MANFDSAISYVLGNEGGYVNDPDDPGGETKYGICKRDHPNVDIPSLTPEAADAIYRSQYWFYDGLQSQLVATKLLDWAVNLEGDGRRGRAIVLLQTAINRQMGGTSYLEIDASYGPRTEICANRCEPNKLVQDMTEVAIAYRNQLVQRVPKLQKFLNGWEARDKKLPAIAATA